MKVERNSPLLTNIRYYYERAYRKKSWRFGLIGFGLLFHVLVALKYFLGGTRTDDSHWREEFIKSGQAEALKEKLKKQEIKKNEYLGIVKTPTQIENDTEKLFKSELTKTVEQLKKIHYQEKGTEPDTYLKATLAAIGTWPGFILSIILAWPMYIYLLILSLPTLHYIVNRLVMML